jgi:hypothetical protein
LFSRASAGGGRQPAGTCSVYALHKNGLLRIVIRRPEFLGYPRCLFQKDSLKDAVAHGLILLKTP